MLRDPITASVSSAWKTAWPPPPPAISTRRSGRFPARVPGNAVMTDWNTFRGTNEPHDGIARLSFRATPLQSLPSFCLGCACSRLYRAVNRADRAGAPDPAFC